MNLSDYVPVSVRLSEAFDRWPELRVQAGQPAVVDIAGHTYVSVTVTVWRSPDDPLPAVATAWERYPGSTAFTRDSEMMNAETSALGRALAVMGVAAHRSLASFEEVRNRQPSTDSAPAAPAPAPPSRPRPADGAPITDRQASLIRAMSSERSVELPDDLDSWTADRATTYIDTLKSVPKVK